MDDSSLRSARQSTTELVPLCAVLTHNVKSSSTITLRIYVVQHRVAVARLLRSAVTWLNYESRGRLWVNQSWRGMPATSWWRQIAKANDLKYRKSQRISRSRTMIMRFSLIHVRKVICCPLRCSPCITSSLSISRASICVPQMLSLLPSPPPLRVTMAVPRNSLRGFLAHAKSSLRTAIDSSQKVTLVIGNESAGGRTSRLPFQRR